METIFVKEDLKKDSKKLDSFKVALKERNIIQLHNLAWPINDQVRFLKS